MFSKNDEVNIFIAQRASEVTGYEAPAVIVVNQLYNRCSLLKKDGTIDPELQKIELQKINDAIHTIWQYGYKATDKNIEDSLKYRWKEEPTDKFIKNNRQEYSKNLNKYHKKLAESIQTFLNRSYPGYTIQVEYQSANKDIFPAMADVAVTLVKDYGVDSVKARKRNLVRGYNIRAFIEDGDFKGATQLVGELFYEGVYEDNSNVKNELSNIFQTLNKEKLGDLWRVLLDICIKKMRERGTDGNSVLNTGNLIGVLDELILQYRPSNIIYAKYLKMKGEYAAHSGKNDLIAEMESLKQIESCLEACEDVGEYDKLLDIHHDYLMEHIAQVQFNSYDFDADRFYDALESYKSRMQSNPIFRNAKSFIDNRYAVICGTIGQMLAFSGEHDKAIEFFQEDYAHTNSRKDLISSFLTVEYLCKEDLKNAVLWFEKQIEDVTGEKIAISQFVPMANDVENTNRWLILNFLRVYAFSLKMGNPVIQDEIKFKDWDKLALGDYPWCLVLKWAAVCNIYANGAKDDSVRLLKSSVDVARKNSMFTINSLALPSEKILSLLGDCMGEEFQKNLDDLCTRCESFKLFASRNQNFLKGRNSVDVWDAAMMLPFNYS